MAYNHNCLTGGTEQMAGHQAAAKSDANTAQDGLRLFTALWPDDAVRRSLARHRDAQPWSGKARPVSDANLHVTLVFLGQVAPSLLPVLSDRLAAVRVAPLELCFDRIEDWGDGLIVLCPHRVPAALAQLHERLRDVSRELGLPLESRAYRPHVTLARGTRGARGSVRRAGGSALIQPASPVRWNARDFVLAQSLPSAPYRILHCFG